MLNPKRPNWHVKRRQDELIARMDALERQDKLLLLEALDECHANRLYQKNHEGSFHCECDIAVLIRKLNPL
jgi:hypothetical protein